MGTWPEFRRCCGVIPLRAGAIIIGTYNFMFNSMLTYYYVIAIIHFMRLNKTIENTSEDASTELEWDEMARVDFYLLFWFVLFSVCEAIVGLLILIGIKKARVLRKAVLYMTIMWLLNLLASLVNASREAYFYAYLNAIRMLLSAYFILIIRSTHLELEGRLDDSDSEFPPSRSQSLSQNTLAFHNPAFQPPPPNYDEATRLDRQCRTGLTLTLVTENEIASFPSPNETQPMAMLPANDGVSPNSNAVTAVLPVNEQTTVNSRRFSTQLSEEDNKVYKHEIEQLKETGQTANRHTDANLNTRNIQGT